jgi:release factor glutamine methyltransferase
MPEPAELPPAHTVLSVLQGAEAWLRKRGHDAPRRAAELLLGKLLGLDRLRLYLAHDRPLDPAERSTLRQWVARVGDGEPLAHVLGSWGFRRLELAVSPAVLIPRPETEELVTLALERAPQGARVIDLGTGSGAIALALASERPDLRITAVDCSAAALEVARRNARSLGLADRVQFCAGSWWQAVPCDARFDLILSNPPYIDPQQTAGLEAGVAKHEPALALFSAPGDVASCYREIAAGLSAHAAAPGWLVMETGVGADQAALAAIQQSPAVAEAVLLPDLAGLPRYLVARLRAAAAQDAS